MFGGWFDLHCATTGWFDCGGFVLMGVLVCLIMLCHVVFAGLCYVVKMFGGLYCGDFGVAVYRCFVCLLWRVLCG